MSGHDLSKDLREAKVIVCAGTGGVGKTTISASLGIEAAMLGRKTLVLTIDPARRLADALGATELGSEPHRVDLTSLARNDEAEKDAHLEAVMLDPKPTFDHLITRLTSDPDARRRILENRIYRHLSEALSGSAEYAAMEQVHEFVESGRYDLVVVDTPPSNHALDFLTAPRRLREFLESRFVHALVQPAMSASRFGFRLFGRPLQRMFSLLERIAGVGFLDDLSEFLVAIDGLSEGFRERATRVENLLLGETTRFILICGPNSGAEATTFEFFERLESLHVRLAAVIVNRVRPWPLETSAAAWHEAATPDRLERDTERLRETMSKAGDPEASTHAATLVELLVEAAEQRAAADATLDALAERVPGGRAICHVVPDLADDLDRLSGLHLIGRRLGSSSDGSQPENVR